MKKALELLFIVVVLLLLTFRFYNPFSDLRISGFEFSYLINSGVVAADMFHETGVIPLWNPFIGQGEPLVENPFSFVLNPLMTLPIVWLGAIQGTKLAILIHILLMATGGWALADTLRLKTPSRVFLGLLLGASGSSSLRRWYFSIDPGGISSAGCISICWHGCIPVQKDAKIGGFHMWNPYPK